MKVEELIENEWYVVRHSGETPEIALHSALYYLTRAKDGPKLTLSAKQLDELQDAATARFFEIIVRDLKHENANKSIYRGVERSIVNYQRYLNFCERQELENRLREKVGKQFCVFLSQELVLLKNDASESIVNCSFDDLSDFADLLNVDCIDQLETLKNQLMGRVAFAESTE